MTHTTELLKELKDIEDKNRELCKRYGRPHNTLYRTNNYSEYTEIKSELKGRLDALKEEVENLQKLGLIKIKRCSCFEHELMNDTYDLVYKRLASIQEEIKLIEEKI